MYCLGCFRVGSFFADPIWYIKGHPPISGAAFLLPIIIILYPWHSHIAGGAI
jgi:hypothetical protein